VQDGPQDAVAGQPDQQQVVLLHLVRQFVQSGADVGGGGRHLVVLLAGGGGQQDDVVVAGLLQNFGQLHRVVLGVFQRGKGRAVVLGDADEQGVLLALSAKRTDQRKQRQRGADQTSEHGEVSGAARGILTDTIRQLRGRLK